MNSVYDTDFSCVTSCDVLLSGIFANECFICEENPSHVACKGSIFIYMYHVYLLIIFCQQNIWNLVDIHSSLYSPIHAIGSCMCIHSNCSVGSSDIISEQNTCTTKFNTYNFFNFVTNMICHCDTDNKLKCF